ncbi:MAG: Cbb3-type cytochrome c oxidase subunit CcoP2 [Alphaproteobacteria bacterium MarineAlpha9_Bin5]|nr:MAG: Cbb3-type cytochrome c oxidase subunit CcoP2 [Alphaproteobacteria bacterium MarineAlpha9_Bin6]PPR39136.1 MAG: Cbb3-type cytochrome c oxidase subunit CcoP2 [Alphaproteobacteria bacterium MarineAlpha9_Bin5]
MNHFRYFFDSWSLCTLGLTSYWKAPIGICLLLALLSPNITTADEATSEAEIREGKRTFSVHCAQCHGIGGAGGGHSRNGPSLTDAVTIYGGELEDIYRVISEGIPRAAMPQWKQRMPEARIRQLAAYVFSIKGTRKQNNLAKNANNKALPVNETDLADGLREGKRNYRIHCAQCHGLSGAGGVGPNLTDDINIHGRKFQDIVKLITNGVPDKLMPAWGEKFGSQTINQIAAYVRSINATQAGQDSSLPDVSRETLLESEDFKTKVEGGKRGFNSHCIECHGSGGKGGMGPNLTDEFTLHGQELEDIVRVITNGVPGLMPTWGQKMSEERVAQFAAYVFSIVGTRPTGKRPPKRVSRLLNNKYIQTNTNPDGKRTFVIYCEQCHGMGGLGGAGPNLTDEFTLHGDTLEDIVRIITNGIPKMQMPTWSQTMSAERIKQVAAYVLSLNGSRPTGKLPDSDRPKQLRGISPFR